MQAQHGHFVSFPVSISRTPKPIRHRSDLWIQNAALGQARASPNFTEPTAKALPARNAITLVERRAVGLV